MENIIIMGNFNFCPLHQMPVLGNDCQECEYIRKVEADFFCICEPEEDASSDEFDLKQLINIMIDLLYAGQTSIKREELISILDQEQ